MQTLDEIKKNVEHPSYYGGADNPYEAIKVLREWQLDKDAYLWNVGKYLSRAGHKDGNSQLQDLTKARFYLDYKIRLLEEQQKVAESVIDTLKKVPSEVADKLTTMLKKDINDYFMIQISAVSAMIWFIVLMIHLKKNWQRQSRRAVLKLLWFRALIMILCLQITKELIRLTIRC